MISRPKLANRFAVARWRFLFLGAQRAPSGCPAGGLRAPSGRPAGGQRAASRRPAGFAAISDSKARAGGGVGAEPRDADMDFDEVFLRSLSSGSYFFVSGEQFSGGLNAVKVVKVWERGPLVRNAFPRVFAPRPFFLYYCVLCLYCGGSGVCLMCDM